MISKVFRIKPIESKVLKDIKRWWYMNSDDIIETVIPVSFIILTISIIFGGITLVSDFENRGRTRLLDLVGYENIKYTDKDKYEVTNNFEVVSRYNSTEVFNTVKSDDDDMAIIYTKQYNIFVEGDRFNFYKQMTVLHDKKNKLYYACNDVDYCYKIKKFIKV